MEGTFCSGYSIYKSFWKKAGFFGIKMESSGVSAVYIERLKLNSVHNPQFGAFLVDCDVFISNARRLSRKLGCRFIALRVRNI